MIAQSFTASQTVSAITSDTSIWPGWHTGTARSALLLLLILHIPPSILWNPLALVKVHISRIYFSSNTHYHNLLTTLSYYGLPSQQTLLVIFSNIFTTITDMISITRLPRGACISIFPSRRRVWLSSAQNTCLPKLEIYVLDTLIGGCLLF